MVWQAEEWQSASGLWHCGCVKDLAHDSNAWYLPARILNLTPAAYVKFMVDNYNPIVQVSTDKCLVFFSWEKQSDMRLFKNFINKKARDYNFQI